MVQKCEIKHEVNRYFHLKRKQDYWNLNKNKIYARLFASLISLTAYKHPQIFTHSFNNTR